MQGIPAVLYARWAAGSEFQNFPPRAVPCGKNWQLPQKTPGPSVRFALWAVSITPGLMGGESATSAYRYGGYI